MLNLIFCISCKDSADFYNVQLKEHCIPMVYVLISTRYKENFVNNYFSGKKLFDFTEPCLGQIRNGDTQ